jgi:hypothetical protein
MAREHRQISRARIASVATIVVIGIAVGLSYDEPRAGAFIGGLIVLYGLVNLVPIQKRPPDQT